MLFVILTTCVALGAAAPQSAPEFAGNRLLVSSVGSNAVLEYGADGSVDRTFADPGLVKPRGIAFGADGKLYVVAGNSILRLNGDGQVEATLGAAAGLTQPRGLAIGPSGHLFVTSSTKILELATDGALVRTIGAADGLGVPVALAFGADGHLFVAAAGTNEVIEYDATFEKVRALDLPDLAVPMGLAFGPDGSLFVSSFFANEVLHVDASGAVTDSFADPALLFPAGLAIGPNGHLFVAPFFGDAILEFDPAGVKVAEFALPDGVTYPEGLTFAPFRFSARIDGRFTAADGTATKVKSDAVVGFAPGGRTILLDLVDTASTTDLVSRFGRSSFVFHGFEAATIAGAKQRLIQGTEVVTVAPGIALGSHHLTVKGKSSSFGNGTAFRPTSAKGSVQFASPAGLFRGTITTLEVLD